MKNTKNPLNEQNSLILRSNPRQPYVKTVIARLQGKERIIGNLDLAGDGTFTTTRKEKHLFRKTNSLGVPYALLVNEKIRFKWIVINYLGRKLVTSRNYFLKKGHIRQYKNFELQVLLPLEMFGIQKAREFDLLPSQAIQTSLFEVV